MIWRSPQHPHSRRLWEAIAVLSLYAIYPTAATRARLINACPEVGRAGFQALRVRQKEAVLGKRNKSQTGLGAGQGGIAA